jgi:hypothetical protein
VAYIGNHSDEGGGRKWLYAMEYDCAGGQIKELTHTAKIYPGAGLESKKSPERSTDREDMELTGNE